MRRLLAAVLPVIIALGATPVAAAPAVPDIKAPARHGPKMVSLQLVILKRGPAWTPNATPEVHEIQKQHIAHLTKLGEEGKILVAGPFSEQSDAALRGMCLYRVGSVEEARRLAEEDPAVKAGRMAVEVMQWWYEEPYLAFPKAPPVEAPPAEPTPADK